MSKVAAHFIILSRSRMQQQEMSLACPATSPCESSLPCVRWPLEYHQADMLAQRGGCCALPQKHKATEGRQKAFESLRHCVSVVEALAASL